MIDKYNIKLGRFYDGDKILQNNEVLQILNTKEYENRMLIKTLHHDKMIIEDIILAINNSNNGYVGVDELKEILEYNRGESD